MAEMTPEQLHAHNMLTHTLWPEWVMFCILYTPVGKRTTGDQAMSSQDALEMWLNSIITTFGELGGWTTGSYHNSDYEIAGGYYTWIP